MEKLLTVTVTDASGKSFSRDWKREADRLDIIRWMAENGDMRFYINVNTIKDFTITETEK